jgi:hypothetical protein
MMGSLYELQELVKNIAYLEAVVCLIAMLAMVVLLQNAKRS